MRIVFLGTPVFGLPCLEALHKNHEVVAVCCQPDKPSKRNKIIYSPVKQYALERGLRLLQFEKISRDGIEVLSELNADLFVTVAYGQLLSERVLSIPRYGVFNVHGSALPSYRGASPIQSAIINGDKSVGLTIMRTVLKMDAGDIILTESYDILQDDTSFTLMNRLSQAAPKLLLEAIKRLENGSIEYIPQKEEDASYCVKLLKETAEVDFGKSSKELCCFIRGYYPSPIAFTYINGEYVKILFAMEAACEDIDSTQFSPGEVVVASAKKGLFVKTGDELLELVTLQGSGGKPLSAKQYLAGHKVAEGSKLGVKDD